MRREWAKGLIDFGTDAREWAGFPVYRSDELEEGSWLVRAGDPLACFLSSHSLALFFFMALADVAPCR